MRRVGWGSINLGPITRGVLERFMVKLGKALYYKHISEVFDSVIYARHVNATAKNSTPEFLTRLLHLAPELASTERNGRSLMDQFVYRFNVSGERGVVYAVPQFSEQMIFQIYGGEAGYRRWASREKNCRTGGASRAGPVPVHT
jgi:hypothetical protein